MTHYEVTVFTPGEPSKLHYFFGNYAGEDLARYIEELDRAGKEYRIARRVGDQWVDVPGAAND